MAVVTKIAQMLLWHGCRMVGVVQDSPAVLLEVECICGHLFSKTSADCKMSPYCTACGAVRSKLVKQFAARCRRLLGKMWRGVGDCDRRERFLGYGREALVARLAEHPHWERFQAGPRSAWSFDHIRPLSVIFRLGVDHPRIANALDNIQPMDVCVNNGKGAMCDPGEIREWLERKQSEVRLAGVPAYPWLSDDRCDSGSCSVGPGDYRRGFGPQATWASSTATSTSIPFALTG